MDLADEHAPVSDFLALSGDCWPPTARDWQRYALSEEQLQKYEQDGFIDGVRILNDAQVARLNDDLAKARMFLLVVLHLSFMGKTADHGPIPPIASLVA